MSDTAKDRHLRCFFGILNLCGLMDTDDYADDKKEIIYSEVRLPLFSHQTYTIKTTFNRNFTYRDTYIKDSSGNDIIDEFGNPIKKTSDNFATIYTPSLGENETHLLQSYEGKYYQKKFRREVLWDFGDGTKKEGYSAEHNYKKPGRYKITCTFFDINRKAWVNDYCIYVVVKEVLPTILRFDKSQTKTDIKCSKIEKIARLEALNSNTIKDDLIVNVKRIFNEKEHEDNYEEIGNDYKSLLPNTFKFMEKYWTLLENKQTLFYNSDVVHSDYLIPTETFTPKYNQIYGKFYYDELNDCMGISLYQVIPYKNIDENLKTIELLNPNANILSSTKEEYQQYSITHVYTQDQLPDGVFPVGKRGWFDIFYRNDFTGNDNVFSIFYEIEKKNITGELETAANYLNINPLGLSIKVSKNDISNIRVGVSLDGFLRPLDSENIKDARYFIDQHLYNSLFKGIDLDIYVFPYIPYQKGQESFEVNENMYYVPKDVTMTVYPEVKTIGGNSMFSFINHGGYVIDGNIVQTPFDDYIVGIHPWFYRIPLILRNYINIKFTNELTNGTSSPIRIELSLIKKSLSNTQKVLIPKEKYNKEDVERLLDVYMGHPMFNNLEGEKTLSQNGKVQLVPGKSKIRQLFEAVLGNGFLNDILTSSDNFLDNTSNVKRCYLSNLISTLQMMGEDVTLFEKGAFEGINDLKNFVRFLSMNHTELIGHKVNKELDIRVQKDLRGANVGEQISLDDVLYLRNTYNSIPVDSKNSQYIEDNLGKIYKVKLGNKKEALINHINGVDLIIHDRYTNDTKVVSFNPLQVALKNKNKEMLSEIKIADYDESWGWNLLLPDSFANINKKVKELSKRIDELTNKIEEMETSQNSRGVRLYSLSQIDVYRDELKKTTQEKARLSQIARDLIDGYYTFHLLNPNVDQERVGNFIDGQYISERIENVDDWNETWGITHEILMKILFENGYLYNGRQFNEDGDEGSFNVTHINIDKSFKNEVDYEVKVDGVTKNYEAKGIVTLFGDILDEGNNTLTVSLRDGLLNDVDNFYMLNENFEVTVTENGNFITKSQTYDVFGERVIGSITITISGTISQPNVNVSSVLNYNPIVLQGNVFAKTMFECAVYKNGSSITNTEVRGLAQFSGIINGIGNNQVVASIPELNIYQDEVVKCPVIVQNNNRSVDVVVSKQGEINEKTITFEIYCDYDEETEGIGNVIVTIGGTVENPICTANAEFNLKTKQDLLPDFYQENVFVNNLNQKIKVYTSYNGATQEFVDVSYLINQFKCVLTRKDNTKNYDVNVEFDLYSLDYTPIDGYETWRTDANCTKQLEVTVDSLGQITTPVTFDVQLVLGNDAKPIFGYFECNISGNILTNNVQITLTEHEQFKGYYSYLFDLDKTYDKNSDNFNFNNFNYVVFEKVRIYTVDGKKLYFEPIEENHEVALTFKVEYMHLQDIIDEGTGEIISQEETIVFSYNVPYTFNGDFVIDAEGKITHDDIVCNIVETNEEKYYRIVNDFTISSNNPYEVTSFNSTYLTRNYYVFNSSTNISTLLTENNTAKTLEGTILSTLEGLDGDNIMNVNYYAFVTEDDGTQIEFKENVNELEEEEEFPSFGITKEIPVTINEDGSLTPQWSTLSLNLLGSLENGDYSLIGDIQIGLNADKTNLTFTSDSLSLLFESKVISVWESYSWTNFVSNDSINGGFSVGVQGIKGQTGTITLTLDLTKYGDLPIEPVDGVNPIIISDIPIDKYGNMSEQSVLVHLSKEADNVTYTLQGDILIKLVNGNLEVSTSNLQVVVDDANVEIHITKNWNDFEIENLGTNTLTGGFALNGNGVKGGTVTVQVQTTAVINSIETPVDFDSIEISVDNDCNISKSVSFDIYKEAEQYILEGTITITGGTIDNPTFSSDLTFNNI